MTFSPTPPVALLAAEPPAGLLERFTFFNLILVAAAFGLAWFVLHYLKRCFDELAGRQPRARFLVRLLEPVIRILLWFLASVFAIQILAPNQNAFLAAVGSAAIAIGLGAQDLIKNVIGGFVILADRPYQLGDRVRLGDAYGEIDHIGLRSTKLMTPDDTHVTIPNSEILSAKAFNSNSGVPHCMITTEVVLPPSTDPDLALRVGRGVIFSSPFTYLAARTSVALIDAFNQRPYLILRMRAYVYDHRYEPAMMTDLTRRAKAEFARLGIAWGHDAAEPR
jgi:small-conductance mechanosensitive channel